MVKEDSMSSSKIVESANTIKFQHFDLCRDYSDHRYVDLNCSPEDRKIFTADSPVYDKILGEWEILCKELPKYPIYVRTYVERVDLIRAVVVGEPKTPSHDGLFFFDLGLPPNFPNSPPKICYHKHGKFLRTNHLDGYFDKMWEPSSFTILDILLQVRGLMLTWNPYFFDAMEMPCCSVGVYLCSCRTLAHVISKPPRNFEDFVINHFRERSCAILGAMKKYIDAAGPRRLYLPEESTDHFCYSIWISAKEKLEFENLLMELEKGLLEMEKVIQGHEKCLLARDDHSLPDVEKEVTGERKKKFLPSLKPQAKIEKPKRGILKRIFRMVKAAFGMENSIEE